MPNTTPTRRDFLRTGAATAGGLALGLTASPARAAARRATAKNCIVLCLTGGPSQLDTWDPKPTAPSDCRGPFRPIPTRVPGLHLSELFPKMAAAADQFSLVRTLHHTAPPIHEAGFQLLQTGRWFRDGPEWPSAGAVLGHLRGHTLGDYPVWSVLPDARVSTGVGISHGQGAGFLDPENQSPIEPRRSDYDPDWQPSFDTLCRTAGGLVRAGRRFSPHGVFLTVNMFDTVFDAVSWDCHAAGGSLATDLGDYRDTVAPAFDAAFTDLLADLASDGLLDETLVVAVGEFGRTPKLNSNGGRDHWAGCWSAVVAGGGVRGGRAVGTSDATAAEPKDRPVTCPELLATVYHALGIPPTTRIPGPDGSPVPVVEAEPVWELF